METLIAAAVVLVTVALAAFGVGRSRGKASGDKAAEVARREAAGERTKAQAAQDRRRIEDEVRQLPAESGGDELSAPDRLRRDWSRD